MLYPPCLAARSATSILDIVDEGELCSLFTVVLILLVIGGQVSTEIHRRWGWGLAVAGLLAYVAYAWELFQPSTADELLRITVRGLAAGGLILGLSWMILPALHALARFLARQAARSIRTFPRQTQRVQTEPQAQGAPQPPPPQPPPPTQEELAAAARERYAAKLACYRQPDWTKQN